MLLRRLPYSLQATAEILLGANCRFFKYNTNHITSVFQRPVPKSSKQGQESRLEIYVAMSVFRMEIST